MSEAREPEGLVKIIYGFREWSGKFLSGKFKLGKKISIVSPDFPKLHTFFSHFRAVCILVILYLLLVLCEISEFYPLFSVRIDFQKHNSPAAKPGDISNSETLKMVRDMDENKDTFPTLKPSKWFSSHDPEGIHTKTSPKKEEKNN